MSRLFASCYPSPIGLALKKSWRVLVLLSLLFLCWGHGSASIFVSFRYHNELMACEIEKALSSIRCSI